MTIKTKAMTVKTKEVSEEKNSSTRIEKTPKCGIVMPISAIDNCSAEHWLEVQNILKDVIGSAGFDPNLVSDADDSGFIQKRIIQNLYSNEIVICDVSAKNPNVMFELGMRLAFDKPTIIIKDDITDYTFDTSIIEHLTYPRDLRFGKIIIFKENLKKKIIGTHEKATKDKSYTTFLKHFGEYKVAQLQEKEISSEKYMLTILEDLRNEMNIIKRNQMRLNQDSFIIRGEKRIERADNSLFRRIDSVVNSRIDEFIQSNHLENRAEIGKLKLEDNLFEFVEKFDDVRNACGSPEAVKDVIERILANF